MKAGGKPKWSALPDERTGHRQQYMSSMFTVLLVGILHNRIRAVLESYSRHHGDGDKLNNSRIFSLILFV
jgi:hypothetical protein